MTEIRPLRPDDVREGLRFCRASGWNQREEDWRALLALNPDGFVAADSDGRLVGTGGAIRYGDTLGWVCMILVDPESRGWGVGTRIMEEVLGRVAGLALVGLDATPGGRPVYLKLGFRDARPLARLETRVGTSLGDHARGARPLAAADLPAVLDWDRRAFGADRAAVLRWLFGQAPEYAWCVESGAGLAGYCLGRHGYNAEHVGPLVARGAETARDLLTACLGPHAGRRFYLDAPRDEPAWLAVLAGLGFAEQRPFTRMYRGDGTAPGRPREVFAVVGPEFG